MPPFVRHAPAAPRLPLVLDSPHSGEHYPDDFDHAPPRAIVRQAEDTHVARLYRGAPRVGATLIEAVFPRAYIDANRSLDDIDPTMLADPWPLPVAASRKTEQGIGLAVADRARRRADVRPQADRRRGATAHRALVPAVSRGARRRARRAAPRRSARCGTSTATRCPRSATRTPTTRAGPRMDFVLGDRDGTTCAPEFTALVAETVAALGYSVAINDPYKGVETRAPPRPARGAPAQPADRAESPPVHGRDDARADRGLRRTLEADLGRLLARSPTSCARRSDVGSCEYRSPLRR